MRIWAPCTYQVLIVSRPVINKGKKDANLLIEHLLPPTKKPIWPQTSKQKPRGWLYKNALKKLIVKPIRNSKSSNRVYIENIAIIVDINNDNLV